MLAWLERFKGALIAVVVAGGVMLGVYLRGRRVGREAERQERVEKVNEQATQARQEVRDVQRETASMDDAGIADDLKRDWVRGTGPRRR